MAVNQSQGRHEVKYLLSQAEYLLISSRLSAVLGYDENAGRNGYFIRSIYLDDIYETNYYQKLSGISDRKKYRLRAYNNSSDYITLECKEKQNKWVYKTHAVIDKDVCDSIINGCYSVLEHRTEHVCREVYRTFLSTGLNNSVIVDYHREVFVYPVSNLRITFDKNLHAGGFTGFSMFTAGGDDGVSVPVYMNDSVILEIKYDEYIPEFIRSLIPSNIGMPISISKYCMCKRIYKNILF